MARTLPGKEAKESRDAKRARKAANKQAHQQFYIAVSVIGGVFAFIALLMIWYSRS